MIYKIGSSESDGDPYFVDADGQLEALKIIIQEWEREHGKDFLRINNYSSLLSQRLF